MCAQYAAGGGLFGTGALPSLLAALGVPPDAPPILGPPGAVRLFGLELLDPLATLGVALASQAGGGPGVTRVLVGDLTMLHDVGAMLQPPGEEEPRIQVIVGNDGGGTIFDGLEVADAADADAMDRVLYTPHNVRLEQLALAYGWEYRRVTTRLALDQALTTPFGGRQLIEVPLER